MNKNIYGYVRVSSKDQCEDRQLLALKEFGIVERNIYTDKISGKNFNRPQYHRLMKKLKQRDVVVILSIDRLGRNYDEIQNQWRIITKEKQADIVVLDMPLLDTRKSQNNDLTGTFIADLVLQILAYVAQIERENIKQRQKEGIHAAKCRGVQFGRPRKNIPDNFDDVKEKWEKSEINSRQAAQILGISQNTFLRWSHE
ncbi:recombinase family protein [Massilimicrobiota timonensis]|uniref:Recombinase family protein n=1 Tax=Massilimicrobiota timonensis TaxID=1776392 RepID=A0ABT7UJR5_9FIRM|nr:recombinase family protein [Massilimicrobiota timonensis]MDM8195717.1 recombinase family protein [Massilimicrobiota timonensis]